MGDGPDYESLYEDTIDRYAREGRDPSSAIQDAFDEDCRRAAEHEAYLDSRDDSDRKSHHTRHPNSSANTSYRPQQVTRTASNGGFFASIGKFAKAVAEGISEAADEVARKWELERQRKARQQAKYDALYESERGVISRVYPSVKNFYCRIHFLAAVILFLAFAFLTPLWFVNLILGIEALNSFFALIGQVVRKIANLPTIYWTYIAGFYFVTLIIGLMIESHEKKKFYSMVPTNIHHEVEFRFFE